MNIPKHIDEALRIRTESAKALIENDMIISQWLEDNGIDAVDCICIGCEILSDPHSSEAKIREAILNERGC